jgi:hypothetical protein
VGDAAHICTAAVMACARGEMDPGDGSKAPCPVL